MTLSSLQRRTNKSVYGRYSNKPCRKLFWENKIWNYTDVLKNLCCILKINKITKTKFVSHTLETQKSIHSLDHRNGSTCEFTFLFLFPAKLFLGQFEEAHTTTPHLLDHWKNTDSCFQLEMPLLYLTPGPLIIGTDLCKFLNDFQDLEKTKGANSYSNKEKSLFFSY